MLNRWVEVEEVFQTFFKGAEVKKESRERNDMKAKEETYTKKGKWPLCLLHSAVTLSTEKGALE